MKLLLVFFLCGSLFAQQEGRAFFKIFYHQYGQYSAMVKEKDGRVKMVHYTLWNTKVRDAEFRFDVKLGHQGWIDTDFNPERIPEHRCSYFIIHLHNPDELNGAGWSNTVRVGKMARTTRGFTAPLE